MADIPLGGVTVYGRRSSGGTILCTGEACASVLNSLAAQSGQPLSTISLPLEDSPIVNGTQFCAALNAAQPANCNYSAPPSTPVYDSNWQPNGCGTSPLVNWFLTSALSVAGGQSGVFSGNLDEPYQGVSFLQACNRHDDCWGRAFDRGWCDSDFRDDMISACDTLSNSSQWNTCNAFASAYHAAVGPTNSLSNSTYNSQSEKLRCAAWAHDKRANGC